MTTTIEVHDFPAASWDDWVPFGPRNGFSGDRFPELGHGAWRHSRDDHEGCEADERVRCACPGYGRPACCGRATQEDRLCDQCRDICLAYDSEGHGHRFIDLPPRR